MPYVIFLLVFLGEVAVRALFGVQDFTATFFHGVTAGLIVLGLDMLCYLISPPKPQIDFFDEPEPQGCPEEWDEAPGGQPPCRYCRYRACTAGNRLAEPGCGALHRPPRPARPVRPAPPRGPAR